MGGRGKSAQFRERVRRRPIEIPVAAAIVVMITAEPPAEVRDERQRETKAIEVPRPQHLPRIVRPPPIALQAIGENGKPWRQPRFRLGIRA